MQERKGRIINGRTLLVIYIIPAYLSSYIEYLSILYNEYAFFIKNIHILGLAFDHWMMYSDKRSEEQTKKSITGHNSHRQHYK